ncbi:MAG: TrkH family potassium uptake protein [Planctomycetes bacterium]|nr:TrkH family potassium uptake protein [Planctomycetota bacterium]
MRERDHLRRRYRAVLASVGGVSALVGLLILTPLLAWPLGPVADHTLAGFLLPGLLLAAGGAFAWRRLYEPEVVLTMQEGGVIVLLIWLVASVAGAVPLMLVQGLDFTQAVFESVSGWTTTGLSVIDVERASPAILLWRSTMQLAGGAGLAILMLAAIAGQGGASLAAAEGRADHLVPNVRQSALLVLQIYLGYVLVGVLALALAGMGWFDAVNHAFCAVSTGGFSTRAASIGHWDSPWIEGVTLVLMVLGNLSFLTSWCLLRGRFGAVLANGEVRLQALLVPLFVVPLAVGTCLPLYATAGKVVRVAVFETVSALTTTGYSTVAYTDWNAFGVLLLIVLMLIGAGTCSTGGAIKQFRVHLLWRAVWQEVLRPLRPRAMVAVETMAVGDRRVAVTDAVLRATGVFVALYLGTWLLGSVVLVALGNTLPQALFEFASALGTVGLSIGVTGPTTGSTMLWTETVGMLLGRLEFFVVFTGSLKLARDLRGMIAAERA